MIGQLIDGRYRILKVVGCGGMGVVYEAEAIRLGKRPCAIKVLLPEYTRNETVVARFTREAEVAARVKHPNVVEIFDTGTTASNRGYIAMELLRGESLAITMRREGRIPWPRAQKFVLQICRALQAAHAQHVVHRDIKPENCIRTTDDDDPDFIKVLDFGIAKLTANDPDSEVARLTASNSVIGTHAYMSYEQICGEEVDHRVDVWAVGVVLYEMLTGRQPFRGNNQGQIWKAIATHDPVPMRALAEGAGIPEAADEVVALALVKDRDRRYATIEALARAIVAVTADGGPSRPITIPPRVAPVQVDVAAVTAVGDVLDERPTIGVSPVGLTELVPDELKPDTNESARSVVHLSTHPGPDPRREQVQTEVAPHLHTQAAALQVPETTASSRPRTLVLSLAGVATLVTVVLYTTSDEVPPVAGKQEVDRPTMVVDAEPNPPKQELPRQDPPTPGRPTQDADPVLEPDPPKPDPTKKTPTKQDPSRRAPRPEPFATRVTNLLAKWKRSADVTICRKLLTVPELKLKISISPTGQVSVDSGIHKNSPADTCLRRTLDSIKFPTANPGEPGFKTTAVDLKPA